MDTESTNHRQHGMSLIEASIVMVVVAVLSGVIIQTIRSLASTQSYVRSRVHVDTAAERVVAAVLDDVAMCRHLLRNDDAGRAVLARLDTDAVAPLAGSRLPVASDVGRIEPDAPGESHTGNLLAFACGAPYIVIDAGDDVIEVPRRVDVCRFVVYGLAQRTGGAPLDLFRWTSVRLARHRSIAAELDEAVRIRTLRSLHAKGVRHAWRAGDPAAQAFFSITPDGTFEPLPGTERVPGDPGEVLPSLIAARHLRVTHNGGEGPTAVPRYARPADGFPHGFEIKFDGNARAGLLLVRLVLATRSSPHCDSAIERVVRVVEE